MGLYAVGFWLPQLLKNAGAGDALHIGLFTAIPYGAAMVVMLVIARRSDASGKRRRYISASALAGSVGLAVSALYGDTFVVALSALTVATMGILVIYPLLWTFPARYFTGPAAAMGIAVVNSLGATAGFVSPYLIGVVCDMTHSTVGGVLVVAGFVLVGGAAAARLP
jgi:MFS family permease